MRDTSEPSTSRPPTRDRQRVARRGVAVVTLALAATACASTHDASSSAPRINGRSTTTRARQALIAHNGTTGVYRLVAATGAAGDSLGGTVWFDTFSRPIAPVHLDTPGEAAMSDDGSVAVVGAPGASGGPRLVRGAGSVHVFARSTKGWVEAATLHAPDGAAYDGFGTTVALSGDGHDLLVGAPYVDRSGAIDVGTVYAFHAVNGHFQLDTELHASDARAYDNFGWSLALSSDGFTAVVGAPAHNLTRVTAAGAAYVYTRASQLADWTQRTILHAPAPQAHADFGAAVALSANGATAVVTAVSHIDAQHLLHAGAAYVLGAAQDWRTYRVLATFTDPSPNPGHRYDSFGVAAAISGDGRVIAVSAPNQMVGSRIGEGYVNVYSTSSSWAAGASRARLTIGALHPAAYSYFGSSLALSRDGRRLLIGVDGSGREGEGSLAVVDLPAFTAASLLHDAHVTEIAPAHHTIGRLGASVALSGNGRTAVATAPMLAVGRAPAQGVAYLYDWSGARAG